MKKDEIMELVEKKRKLDRTEWTQDRFKHIRLYGGEWLFPDCDALKDEFKILEKELKSNDSFIRVARDELPQKCEHQVRLQYRGHHPDYNRCAICNKVIYDKNSSEWKQSADLNNNYITFYSAYQDGEQVICHTYDVEGLHLVNPYSDHHLLDIIEYVLKDKNNNDEIDLVAEIDKLDLPNKEVHKGNAKHEKFVLIFGGSNRIKIDDDNYIFRRPFLNSLKFVDYFLGLMNVKVCLIDNPEVINPLAYQEQYNKSNPYLNKISYSYLEKIDMHLDEIIDVDFDLIIDISELFEPKYTIEDGKVKLTRTSIDFKKYFPNSRVVKVNHYNLGEEDLMQKELQEDDTYGFYRHVYQKSNNGKVASFEGEEKICDSLKLTLKRKGK